MTEVRFSVYLSLTSSLSAALPGTPGASSKPSMYPCSVRIRAISRFSPLAGISTVSCAAMIPLRIRVRKSAIGSVIDTARSPTRLGHAGDHAVVRQLAQTQAADAELAIDGARTPATATTRVRARLVLGRALGGDDLGCLCHSASSLSRDGLAGVEALVLLGTAIARERHPERVEQGEGLGVGLGRRRDGHVEPADLVHLVVVDLREDDLLAD